MTEILRITPLTTEEADLWRLAEEVAAIFEGLPWVLIGGVMVRILEAEHGVLPAFATGDLDAVLDLRALTTATRIAAERLSRPLERPGERSISGGISGLSRTSIHGLHARSDILPFVKGREVEREKGLEPSTFCLGSRL